MALMKQARERNRFKRPSVAQFVPKGMEDVVARVSAAGQKMMYAPEMREMLVEEVSADRPVPLKLAHAVSGLMLMLDQQAKQGGIPQEAWFPAGLDLLGEAAEVLEKATGEPVTQEEFNEAARTMFVIMAKKLGASDDDIMKAAEQHAGAGAATDDEAAEPMPDAEAPEGEEEVQ